MFNEEFNKVAGAAKAKNELLKNNKVYRKMFVQEDTIK